MAAAACFRAVSSLYLGERPTVGGSLSFAASRLLPVILLAFLYFLGLIPAFLAVDHPRHLAGRRVVGELPRAAVGGHRARPRRSGGPSGWSRAAGGRRSGRCVLMNILVGVISGDHRRAAHRDADRLDRERGDRRGHLDDRQHPLGARHAADLRGRADRPLLRPAGAQGGLRPAAARARRRAGPERVRHEPAGGRRGERARRRVRAAGAEGSRHRQPPQGGGFAPPSPPSQGGFAPPQAPGTTAPQASSESAPAAKPDGPSPPGEPGGPEPPPARPPGGLESGDPLAAPPERREGEGEAGS